MATWEERMKEAAARAAFEACLVERSRCLRILDDVIRQLETELQKKLLIETQRHLIETKLRIARSIVNHAKTGITMGFQPKDEGPQLEGVG